MMLGREWGDGEGSAVPAARPRIRALREVLHVVEVAPGSDRDRIALLAELTELAAVIAGAQARLTVAYADSQRSVGASARGVAAEIGMARRVGLSRASDLVARSRVLVENLPETLAQLASGVLGEERAHIVADRVLRLEPAARELVDEMVASDLSGLSDHEVRECVDRAVHRVDPAAVARRRAAALTRRHVGVRTQGDGMADLFVRCSVVDAAAAMATLVRHADGHAAARRFTGEPTGGDDPTREQLMADTAVAWLTGREKYEGPPVEVQLVMPATGLFADPLTGRQDDSPAELIGIGPLPAAAARELLGRDARTRHDPAFAADARAVARLVDREASRVTARRVWTTPDGRDVVGIESGRWVVPEEVRAALRQDSPSSSRDDPAPDDGRPASGAPSVSRRAGCPASWLGPLARPPAPGELADLMSGERCYRGLLRRFVILRDQRCRAPWCGASIRHIDHVRPYRDAPRTTTAGGIGACVGHNLAKESLGHRVDVDPDATSHTITWLTPTGLQLRSIAPPLLGWGTQPAAGEVVDGDSPLERTLEGLLSAA